MSAGRSAQRDIVQFVPFRKFKTVRFLFVLLAYTIMPVEPIKNNFIEEKKQTETVLNILCL